MFGNDLSLEPYDAVLLISFGGPESPEEVMPFLQRVTAGREVPPERLEQVAEHYLVRDGVSPINARTRDLAAALRTELGKRGISIPVAIGNRNAAPFIADGLAELVDGGATRILSVLTSAYPGYSSCRQYQENVAEALTGFDQPPTVDRIRHYAHHPGFVSANAAAAAAALGDLGAGKRPDTTRLVFVTHSLPVEMADSSGPPPRSAPGSYVEWHQTVAAEVCHRVSGISGRTLGWDLAYCSRSGRPTQPWLEPDINDHLRALAADGVEQVVIVPIGFVSEHMEVVQDLDTEAMATANDVGIRARRAATAGTHPDFIAGLIDLMDERARLARGETVLPSVINHGIPGRHTCPADCCPHPVRSAAPPG